VAARPDAIDVRRKIDPEFKVGAVRKTDVDTGVEASLVPPITVITTLKLTYLVVLLRVREVAT
jgi:hypothetical protein